MGILSLLMAMLIIPATQVAATVPTIDTSETGSITIHKYEDNTGGGVAGTGTTADKDNVPSTAVALKDAGFTLYQVADVDDLQSYYAKEGTTLPTVASFFKSGAYSDTDASTWVVGNLLDTTVANKYGNEQKTDANGETTFSSLPLGIYLVVETTTPAAVTTPVKPFLVSVPMTTSDGSDWLYDVHVYPKNETTYGGVTLKKTGDGNVLAGVKFELQKENADGTWTTITKASGAGGDNTGADLTLTTDAQGEIKVEGLSQGTYRFIETDIGTNTEYIMDGATVYEFVVGADGSITDSTGNAITEISVSNYKPELTKEVKQNATSTTYGEKGDYSVGDTVDYKVTISIPENITSLKTFQIVDVPTNITDTLSSIEMTVDGTAVATAAYSTPTQTGNGFTIQFVPAEMAAYAGKDLVIEYQATLNTAPADMKVGNENTATLTYSNNIIPTDTTNPNNGKTETTNDITDDATVYSFAIEINKTGEDGTTALSDVTFEMYKKVATGTTGALTEAEYEAAGLSDPGTGNAWLKVNGTTLTTDGNGQATQTGLANGTYYLVETKTNEGYNLLSKPLEVEVNVEYIDSQGNYVAVTDDTATVNVNIKNSKGFTLPITGGAGTLIFTLIGCVLVGGGAIILFRLKKKPQNA